LDVHTCSLATRPKSTDCLRYLHENGCPWENSVCYDAIRHNNLESLRYLHENGCPWDENATCYAAIQNSLDCLQYLHENGCPFQKTTCYYAAYFGMLDCLRYAYEHGCPWVVDIYGLWGFNHNLRNFTNNAGIHPCCMQYLNDNGLTVETEPAYCMYAT
jgi:hypothetical protein